MNTETKVEPTPRPWKVNHVHFNSEAVEGPTGELVAYMGDAGYAPDKERPKANAEYIVRAVNSHEELVGAVEDGYEALRDIINAADNGEPYTPYELGELFNDITGRMHDTLAKAKEEEE